MANLAAVVGIGQTKYQTKRGDVSIAGLVREAAFNALQDADLSWGRHRRRHYRQGAGYV